MNYVLASASERRKELLKRLVPNFKAIVSGFNEDTVIFNGSFSQYVMNISEGKVADVKDKLKDDAVIIGCDTIVAFKNQVMGKPKSESEAFQMLTQLSGNTHQVYSGITVYNTADNEMKRDFVCTDVKFSDLSDSEIRAYIKTGEPMGKAGAYGIQGYGGLFVEKINGCYYNVVGLPLNKLNYILREMGVNLY
ncbi:Maf-like protein [Clostridium sp. JN-9]|uniref:Maf-like protein n=1 Tax=Clostridium sp. JN-9 TaxID=2507159 RepID=UPI000FFE267B|nr:Maf-like protein [Clostridium sp. JN-9]QAT39580.1 Maf-like protein [Clostridium sp. JN-9]